MGEPAVKVGQAVAFYPGAGDPGHGLSTAVLARVVQVLEDGAVDLSVDGALVTGVERLAEGEHATPRTWAP